MPLIRIFHDGDTVLGTEHRLDETYTDENRPPRRETQDWFTAADADLYDGPPSEATLVPFEALRATGAPGARALGHDPAVRDQRRQERRDREKGGGGELDALYAKLATGTLTPVELTQMLRLERGL